MTQRNILMIVVDARDADFDQDKIKSILKRDDNIRGWWNHLPGCFLVVTELDARELTELFGTVTGDVRLLIVRVDLSDIEGWLHEDSWDWIRRHAPKPSSKAI